MASKVKDVMTSQVVCVRPSTPYKELVLVLTDQRLSAVPVVDDQRRVLGVVSEADLLLKYEQPADAFQRFMVESRRHRLERLKAGGGIAVELMTRPVVTIGPEAEVAEAARLLRTRGSKDKRTFTQVGFNSRLDELQAAGLRVLLPHLAEWIEARLRSAAAYVEAGLGDLAQVQSETEGARSAWHIFAIASDRRERLATALEDARVGARPYYETPLYRQPALQSWAPPEPLAETERICSQILALPMGAALPEDAPAEVVGVIRSALD